MTKALFCLHSDQKVVKTEGNTTTNDLKDCIPIMFATLNPIFACVNFCALLKSLEMLWFCVAGKAQDLMLCTGAPLLHLPQACRAKSIIYSSRHLPAQDEAFTGIVLTTFCPMQACSQKHLNPVLDTVFSTTDGVCRNPCAPTNSCVSSFIISICSRLLARSPSLALKVTDVGYFDSTEFCYPQSCLNIKAPKQQQKRQKLYPTIQFCALTNCAWRTDDCLKTKQSGTLAMWRMPITAEALSSVFSWLCSKLQALPSGEKQCGRKCLVRHTQLPTENR